MDTLLRTHCCGHIVADTLLRTHCCGHIVADTLLRTHCCGHIVADTLLRTHCCGHIVADTLLRTHCCGHIAAHDVSWARKRAGHKMNVVFLCCANWETFVTDTKFVSQQMLRAFVARTGKRGNICVGNNVSATMCPRLPVP